MPWELQAIFDNESITDVQIFVSEYQFSLKGIAQPITIRIYKNINRNWYEFTQSHYIHTPTQGGPYITSRPWNDDEKLALHQAVSGVTTYYNSAIREGHAPQESWLVKNEDF